ncbi:MULTISPECIES: aminodeoxychorismate/anthranilate synthase component II [Halobacteriovorax]|uniref:aminodeoxychorismate/anthranilate synthase component II n=1 Tax=Halobacteriovorax TaxID=1652133 RepID=UPI001314FAD6|nr:MULTISPECIES: aminodeoxychorismate/anthranilate synthase component II [Halobacteriovorax]
MRIIFVDFEDSFTNNIISYLSHWKSCEIEVINFRDLKRHDLVNQNIILGPGPGHPSEYIDFFKQNNLELKANLKKARRIVGICLGHQLVLSSLYQCTINRSKYPIHGRTVKPKDLGLLSGIVEETNDINLQRYNSLYVEVNSENSLLKQTKLIFDNNNELLMAYEDERIFTMQFHPESVGTSCSESIFQAIERFFV